MTTPSFFQGSLVLLLTASTVYMALGLFRLKRTVDLLLAAGILTAGIICLLTEILSVFHMLTLSGLLLGHSLAFVGVLFLWATRHAPRPQVVWNWRRFWERQFRGQPLLQIMAFVVAVIVAATLTVALYSPPNNADSMTYHMARVGYWYQQGSLQHYYANIDRQNSFSPGSGILILWTVLLSGSDRWANLIQSLAFMGSLLAIYAVARRLGFEKHQGMFALLLAAAIPIFVLQATSTQNDLVSGYFLIASLYFLITWVVENRSELLLLSCWAGSLSVLAKSLSGTYLPLFALVVVIQSLSWKQKITSFAIWGLCFTFFLVFTAGPYLVRNVYTYATPTGPTYSMLNQSFSLVALAGNAFRNLALHVELPPIPQKLPKLMDDWSAFFGERLGVDLNDPSTTLPGVRFNFRAFRPHEDHAGVGLPLLGLLTIALGMFVMSLRKGPCGALRRVYLAILLLAPLVFITVFRWQPWNTRYHVPLVLLFCPLLAVLHHGGPIKSIGQICLSYAVFGGLLLGLASALFNYSRPLLPVASKNSIFQMSRSKMIYVNRPWLQCVYEEALKSQPNGRRIGLHVGSDDYEYPLFGKRFERMLFPLAKETFKHPAALSNIFSNRRLDLVISTIPPTDGGESFVVRPLPIDCPDNTWPDVWRRSAIREAQVHSASAMSGSAEPEDPAAKHHGTIDSAQGEDSSYWLILRK